MFSDRLNHQSQGKMHRQFSIQALLNCGAGKCKKDTTPFDVLVFVHKYGIPEEGCQSYLAKTPLKESCSNINNCASCSGTAFKSACKEVKNYKRWKLFDYGSIISVQNMKD
eukprot:GHVR01112338.1.p1 GENE.GHVR01112338.1~~GHVR01112338.1.p1  ORF type:complete len:111 (+),score=7.52 GHVR01112338.1:974-1306(+)